MVIVIEISLSEFLEGYNKSEIFDIVNVAVQGVQRLYGRTVKDQGDKENHYKVVYAVIA